MTVYFTGLVRIQELQLKKSGGVKLVVEIRQLFPIKRTILQVITKTHIVKEKSCKITERRE